LNLVFIKEAYNKEKTPGTQYQNMILSNSFVN